MILASHPVWTTAAFQAQVGPKGSGLFARVSFLARQARGQCQVEGGWCHEAKAVPGGLNERDRSTCYFARIETEAVWFSHSNWSLPVLSLTLIVYFSFSMGTGGFSIYMSTRSRSMRERTNRRFDRSVY